MGIMKPYGFMSTMKETLKILSQKSKPIALIAILQFFLYSLLFLLNTFSTKSLIYDLLLKITEIGSATSGTGAGQLANQFLVEIKEDVGFFLGIELAFSLISFSISLFIIMSIIIISASYYSGESLSLKELILMVAKSWTRAFVTGFYITLIGLGYTTLVIVLFAIPSLALMDHHPIVYILLLPVLTLVVTVFYLYLSVVWILGWVVSVVEERSGLEALGKARQLVKGMRLQGFVLNVVMNIVVLILYQVSLMIIIRFEESVATPIITTLIQLILICLVSFFMYTAYTVLYFQCKKKHGQDISLQGSLDYSKAPTHEEVV